MAESKVSKEEQDRLKKYDEQVRARKAPKPKVWEIKLESTFKADWGLLENFKFWNPVNNTYYLSRCNDVKFTGQSFFQENIFLIHISIKHNFNIIISQVATGYE